jgi:hypothetical protein
VDAVCCRNKVKHFKVVLVRNYAPRHDDVLESGGIAPYIL